MKHSKTFYLNTKSGEIFDSLRSIAKRERVDTALVFRYLGKKRKRADAKDLSNFKRISLSQVLLLASKQYRDAHFFASAS